MLLFLPYIPSDALANLFNDKLNDLLHMLNQEINHVLTGDFNINTSDAIINPNINVNNFQTIFYILPLYTLN